MGPCFFKRSIGFAGENKIVGYSLIAQRDSRACSFYFRHGYIESDWIHLARNRRLLP